MQQLLSLRGLSLIFACTPLRLEGLSHRHPLISGQRHVNIGSVRAHTMQFSQNLQALIVSPFQCKPSRGAWQDEGSSNQYQRANVLASEDQPPGGLGFDVAKSERDPGDHSESQVFHHI